MPVRARRFVRKMRGGAQAHLLECDDGGFYVVKFRNNPQHRRVLVNEWVSALFLRHLQVSAPEAAIVDITPEFLAANPDVHMQLGHQRVAVEPGWHFGSQFPGHPDRLAVYDFLPDLLLGKVVNNRDFLATLVFDKWMANADARQCIFFRAQIREWVDPSAPPARKGFIAQMVDQGYVFDGPHWNFEDSPIRGIYFRPSVYNSVRSWDDFQPWLDQVVHFPEEVVDEAWKRVPAEWVGEDQASLEALLTKLLARRKRVADLIRECAKGKINPFPNWK